MQGLSYQCVMQCQQKLVERGGGMWAAGTGGQGHFLQATQSNYAKAALYLTGIKQQGRVKGSG